jgi:hypothetical protein
VVAGRRLLAAQNETGLHSLLANGIGQDLIHADPAPQLRPFL